MPKANVTPNAALDTLATQLKAEQAEQQLRLANYFTVFGFNPELEDFQRTSQLLEKYGEAFTETVFAQSSPNLMARVSEAVNEYNQRQATLEALFTSGATITLTDEQLYETACNRVFRNTRAGQQAQHAKIA